MKKLGVFLLALAVLLAVTALALAAAGYDLSWWTADGGGGRSQGGAYVLEGTIGQPDAGSLSGGAYVLVGGFWGGVRTTARLYLPVITR